MKALVVNALSRGFDFEDVGGRSADRTRSPRQRASRWALSHRSAFRHPQNRSTAGGAWTRGCGDSG
jgi:hypothetical protein